MPGATITKEQTTDLLVTAALAREGERNLLAWTGAMGASNISLFSDMARAMIETTNCNVM